MYRSCQGSLISEPPRLHYFISRFFTGSLESFEHTLKVRGEKRGKTRLKWWKLHVFILQIIKQGCLLTTYKKLYLYLFSDPLSDILILNESPISCETSWEWNVLQSFLNRKLHMSDHQMFLHELWRYSCVFLHMFQQYKNFS